MIKYIALLFLIVLGTYYYLDNTVSQPLIDTYCKREAQEQTVMLRLEALKVRDRVSEYDFYEICIKDLKDATILQVLIKSLQGNPDPQKKQFQ